MDWAYSKSFSYLPNASSRGKIIIFLESIEAILFTIRLLSRSPVGGPGTLLMEGVYESKVGIIVLSNRKRRLGVSIHIIIITKYNINIYNVCVYTYIYIYIYMCPSCRPGAAQAPDVRPTTKQNKLQL